MSRFIFNFWIASNKIIDDMWNFFEIIELIEIFFLCTIGGYWGFGFSCLTLSFLGKLKKYIKMYNLLNVFFGLV